MEEEKEQPRKSNDQDTSLEAVEEDDEIEDVRD